MAQQQNRSVPGKSVVGKKSTTVQVRKAAQKQNTLTSS